MKKCPSCAEEIQDEATKCRFCGKVLKKSNWMWWTLGVIVFLYIIGSASEKSNNTIPASKTFAEKYPNVTAFVEDFKDGTEGGAFSERFKRLMATDPNWTTQHIYEQGFWNTYIGQNGPLAPAFHCAVKFMDEHIEDSSCEDAEEFLISHNYLNPTVNATDTVNTTDTINTTNAVNTVQPPLNNTQSEDLSSSFTINIPNSQGGYTSIVLKKSGDGYVGPRGEFYSQFPTVVQLQEKYSN